MCARLPIRFELEALEALEWASLAEVAAPVPFGPRASSGWREVVLRAPGGDPRLFPASLVPHDYAATPALAARPRLVEALARLEWPLLAARVTSLAPEARACERDSRSSEGRVELRVVLRSSPDVRIRVGRCDVRMRPGELWSIDPHEVVSAEGTELLVLVLECVATEALEAQLARAALVHEPARSELAEPPRADEPAGSLEALVRAALADASRTRSLVEASTLGALVTLLAGEPRRDLEAKLTAMRPQPLEVSLDAWPAGARWVPAELLWREAEPHVSLVWMEPGEREAPFFDDAVRLARRRPLHRHLRIVVPLCALEASVAADPPLPLRGLVAHVSRCGSTLVARMLAASGSFVVVSEPPPLDAALRLGPSDVSPTLRRRAIRGVVAALARPTTGAELGLVIKLDAWHLASMDRLRDALPEVPVVLLFREPAQVLASQMHSPGLHMVSGALEAPFDRIPAGLPMLEHRARVVGLTFELASALRDVAVVAYEELPRAVETRIAPYLGLTPGPVALAAMRAAGEVDAKSPQKVFVPRAHERDEALDAAAERHAGPSHRALVERARGEGTT